MQTRADQLAGAGPDRREPGRGRPGPGPQAGRADWSCRQAEQTSYAEAELAARGRPSRRSSPPRPRAEQRILAGRGEGASGSLQVGLSEAAVLLRKIAVVRRPAAVRPVAWWPSTCRKSSQPLVPERVFMAGGNGHAGNGDGHADTAAQGLLRHADQPAGGREVGLQPRRRRGRLARCEEYADRLTREAMEVSPATAGPAPAAPAPAAIGPRK